MNVQCMAYSAPVPYTDSHGIERDDISELI